MFKSQNQNNIKYLTQAVFILSLLMLSPALAAETSLLIATPDNIIATNIQTYTNRMNAPISATVLENNSILFTATNASPENWSAEFIAPLNQQLRAGNYEAASLPDVAPQNAKPPTKPGLNISIGFRQCIVVAGRFDVLEVRYDDQGLLTSLAVDFVQYCNTNSKTKLTALRGALRHNSLLAIETLDPIAIAGADQQVVENNIVDLTVTPIISDSNTVQLDASQSSAGSNATLNSYQWNQISGPSIQFNNSANSTSTLVNPSFTIPNDIRLGGEQLIFELSVVNSNRITDTDRVTIFVASKSDPQTSFYFTSDPTERVGQGDSLYVDQDDAIITVDRANNNHAHLTIDNGPIWFAEFGAIKGGLGLTVAPYINIRRHPVPSSTAAGLNIYNRSLGCADITGSFEVLQHIRDANDVIKNLRIDFIQMCDQTTNPVPSPPQLKGVIKYNYIDTKVPVADAGSSQSVIEGDTVVLDGSASNSAVKGSDRFLWTQVSGTSVTLSDNSLYNPAFTAPAPATDQATGKTETLKFTLLFSNSENFKAQATISIIVTAKIKPVPAEVIEPPTKPTATAEGGSGGGGGCSLKVNAQFEGSLYLLLLLALLLQLYRKKIFQRITLACQRRTTSDYPSRKNRGHKTA